ncbi:hypothetical protein NCC78_22805 [Micromonospora phytophila]|uniref:hypothetical protein n=1 Tax=Micromonospora phytophila TaxID=709888 RepID=UPI0020301601|nr:hypothetical protein [Micromonospora phytophila]MCM0677498.1 hypothetical protein [Micromonospora phytophila]
MTKVLLSVHVLAAIIFIGPVTVAASLFPRYGRAALAGGDPRDAAVVRLLHRISRGYAVLGLTVPAFGVATAVRLGVLTDAWLLASITLTVLAALLLALVVLPAQERVVTALADPPVATGARTLDGGTAGAADGTTGATRTDGTAGATRTDGTAGGAAAHPSPVDLRRLSAVSGVFALLWAVVVVLMVMRPGSITGA